MGWFFSSSEPEPPQIYKVFIKKKEPLIEDAFLKIYFQEENYNGNSYTDIYLVTNLLTFEEGTPSNISHALNEINSFKFVQGEIIFVKKAFYVLKINKNFQYENNIYIYPLGLNCDYSIDFVLRIEKDFFTFTKMPKGIIKNFRKVIIEDPSTPLDKIRECPTEDIYEKYVLSYEL